MELTVGDTISSTSIHGITITGKISAILDYTLVVSSESGTHLILKKSMRKEGYTVPRRTKKRYGHTLSQH